MIRMKVYNEYYDIIHQQKNDDGQGNDDLLTNYCFLELYHKAQVSEINCINTRTREYT